MPLIPPAFASTPAIAFDRLVAIMNDLRANCPWDKKQTLESLRHLTIEETYELSDAILEGDMQEIKKELGDIMLHLVFYAKIGSESGDFNITDVLNGICEKLIHRHPHIYSDTEVSNEEDVKRNWEQLKLKEGNKSVLEGVPASLPALVKASRIQEKARGVGFDWEEKSQVWENEPEIYQTLSIPRKQSQRAWQTIARHDACRNGPFLERGEKSLAVYLNCIAFTGDMRLTNMDGTMSTNKLMTRVPRLSKTTSISSTLIGTKVM